MRVSHCHILSCVLDTFDTPGQLVSAGRLSPRAMLAVWGASCFLRGYPLPFHVWQEASHQPHRNIKVSFPWKESFSKQEAKAEYRVSTTI